MARVTKAKVLGKVAKKAGVGLVSARDPTYPQHDAPLLVLVPAGLLYIAKVPGALWLALERLKLSLVRIPRWNASFAIPYLCGPLVFFLPRDHLIRREKDPNCVHQALVGHDRLLVSQLKRKLLQPLPLSFFHQKTVRKRLSC